MNKSESRYFATAKKMDEAFLELLGSKDFEFITVKEICKKAGVNRSTFYLHYENIGDLLAESARHVNERFMQYFTQDTGMFKKISELPLEELNLVTPAYLTPYLTYIRDNRALFGTVLRNYSVLQMDKNWDDLNTYIINPILERFNVPESEREYLLTFYVEGVFAVIKKWLAGGCEDSVERMAGVISGYIEACKDAPVRCKEAVNAPR